MKLYAAYLKEREGIEVLESEHGFACYRIVASECWLTDVYVAPDFRRQGVAFDLADQVVEIARERGCDSLVGSTAYIQSPEADASIRMMQAYGMRFLHVDEGKKLIFFVKELG